MTTEFPLRRYIASTIFMYFVIGGATISTQGRVDYGLALILTVVCAFFTFLPAFIAYSRNLVKRNTIYWLTVLWFIPFAWIIAIFMIVFGKPESVDTSDSLVSEMDEVKTSYKKEPEDKFVYNESFKYETGCHNNAQIPDNAIDRAFYKIGYVAKNAVSSVRNSRIIRKTFSGFFKLLLVIAILAVIVIIRMIIAESTPYRYTNTYKQQPVQSTYTKTPTYQPKPAKPQKSAEQIWFEQAAASMK